MDSRINTNIFLFYKLQGRRASIVTLQNATTSEKSEFTPDDKLRIEREFKVRTFSDNAANHIVVKSKDLCSLTFASPEKFNEECSKTHIQFDAEYGFFRLAYPNERPLQLGIIPNNTPVSSSCHYRLVMPFIEGFTLHEFQPSNALDLLTFLLAISLELKRLHALRIVHGDIFLSNILAKQTPDLNYSIHFIDFERAYFIDSVSSTTQKTTPNIQRWAPERRCPIESAPKGDVNQDIYSLGFTFFHLLNRCKIFGSSNNKVKEYLPTLFKNICATQNQNPVNRPSLEQIITDIQTERLSVK